MRRLTRRIAAIGAAAVLATGGSIAYAAWTADGTGTAAAKAGYAHGGVDATPGQVDGDLYPGGSGKLTLRLTNTNAFKVEVTAIAVDNNSLWSADLSACSDDNDATFEVDSAIVGSYLAAHPVILDRFGQTGNVADITIDSAIRMLDASDDCIGATFDIPITIEARSYVG